MTKVNLETQVEGTLPKENVEGLTQLMTDVSNLSGSVGTMQGTVGSLSAWRSGLDNMAIQYGYQSFQGMMSIIAHQIEWNRIASRAGSYPGYIPPP